MPQLPGSPKFWLAGFILWFVSLWILSSFAMPGEFNPRIENVDKLQHFGFFFGGAGLLSAALFRLKPEAPDWKRIITAAVIAMALVGWLDEWHQSFTPGRSGNDIYDWLADVLGALAGSFTLRALHRRLKWHS